MPEYMEVITKGLNSGMPIKEIWLNGGLMLLVAFASLLCSCSWFYDG